MELVFVGRSVYDLVFSCTATRMLVLRCFFQLCMNLFRMLLTLRQ